MQHKNRGQALIFNHRTFEKQKERKGTDFDVKKLLKTLTKLHFEVTIYEDKTCDEIKAIIKHISEKVDHSENDCILIVVMSHGDRGSIYAKDIAYPIETLWSPFTTDNCTSLAGKPRFFIIQACQGGKLDGGFRMERSQTDGPSSSYKLPKYADFLIAHSTMSGYISWRHPTSGSWFIQTLCDELDVHGKSLEIEQLLKIVRHKVAIDCESTTKDERTNGQKQIPTTTSTLTRKLIFTEK